MAALRVEVERLIDTHRYRLSQHASRDHEELSPQEKLQIVRWGGRDRPDRNRPASGRGAAGVYVCWATHPVHGRCRGVYAIETDAGGDHVAIITAFPEA